MGRDQHQRIHMPDEATFFASLLFGSIGLGAMLYGKTTGSVRKIIIGAAMIACSYLFSDAWLQWASGAVLTVALIRWKD